MDLLLLALKCAVVFVLGAALFDAVHFILHKFEKSRFALLRFLGGLHGIHHKFLDTQMRIQREFTWGNILHHVIPEFTTAVIGMLALGFIFGWTPVLIVIAIRFVMLCVYIFQKGVDYTHQPVTRIHSGRSLIFVGPRYHALHHVWENQHYSSFVNIFDFVFGTNCQISGRRFLVTGANGAFSSEMVKELRRRGGLVETAASGTDFFASDISAMEERLKQTDVLVLCHGAKGAAAWDANYTTCVRLIERFRDLTLKRLVPGEVWGMGSEIELHPTMGALSLREYSASKRAFAIKARGYYSDPDLIYRHIVCSAFTSQMGRGWISARVAVLWSLFFIKRGFHYVPVTYTTLAYWNYFKFLSLKWNKPPVSVRDAIAL